MANSHLDFVSVTIRRYSRRLRRLIVNYSFYVSFKGAQGSQGTSGIPGLAGPAVSFNSYNTLKSVSIKSIDARFLLLKLQSFQVK